MQPSTKSRLGGIRALQWWDREYLPAVLLCCWAGFLWSVVALFVSMTWDLDQGWHERSPFHLLVPRILLLWPVWASVQAEDALATLGWHIGDAWPVLLFLSGMLPLLAATALWITLSGRRR